jgi:DNA-binding NtrC family response regulator
MGKPLSVLIIDDSDLDATLLLRILRAADYDVTYEVVQTQDAMRVALERRDWNLITSDQKMPCFDALTALTLAKQLKPSVPFVVVSDETDLNSAVSLIKAGACDYVQKHELKRLVPLVNEVCF